MAAAGAELQRDDVQGFVVSGYGKMGHATFAMLSVSDGDGARRWLAGLAPRVTNAVRSAERRCVNVAFTAAGLRALGMADADVRTFSVPFQEGMAVPHRSRVLGDHGASDPSRWEWGARQDEDLHVLLLLYAVDADELDDLVAEELGAERLDGALRLIRRLDPERLPGEVNVGKFGVEHFGFADGMSQPVVEGSGQEAKLAGDDARRSVIAAGEFVLGYPNGYGKLTPVPKAGTATSQPWEFGRSGTYLVFRHLYQDVAAFWQYLDRVTGGDEEARVKLAAKFVGRWPSGAPLVRSPHRDDPDLGADNSFGYAEWDPHGFRCPVGSHIRRTNPRDFGEAKPARDLELSNLHRIVRRGRVYGPGLDDPLAGDDGVDRGLFFICLNANIERQFEFVQHHWSNNTKFRGLYDEADPVSGTQPEEGGAFTVQAMPVRRRYDGITNFVIVRGGAYFFLPGIEALRRLASGEASAGR
ncbi:MAG TPA: Dyp-type peroxidase [Acidimicrobiales bacterium]|jgi:Dyp-type peroxidase family|nr:Dyp-type peroxidase [Acidimicrobiales bacterium]